MYSESFFIELIEAKQYYLTTMKHLRLQSQLKVLCREDLKENQLQGKEARHVQDEQSLAQWAESSFGYEFQNHNEKVDDIAGQDPSR